MDSEWRTEQMVIWGETFPEVSRGHLETVCTGAVLLDRPGLIRLYPLPLRSLPEERRPKKWDIIEARIRKSSGDSRAESFNIDADSIRITGHLPTDNGWAERRRILLRDEHFVDGIEDMERRQEATGMSLGIIRSSTLHDVFVEPMGEADRREAEAKYDAVVRQLHLFRSQQFKPLSVPVFMPRIEFQGAGDSTSYNRVVRDWEIIEAVRRHEHEKDPEAAFHDHFFGHVAPGKEFFVILGNINRYPGTFIVVALLYPPKQIQLTLGL